MLLDSVIVIDHLNGIESASRFLVSHPDACVSAITRAEVLCGIDGVNVPSVRALLDRWRQVPIDAEVADLAAALRREHRWKLPDAIQAAAASLHGLRLVTRNVKDFPPKRFPFVLVPYRV